MIAVFAITACGSAATEAPAAATEAPAAATEAPAEVPAAMGESVEVFSWWTGGGEAAGLEAMIGRVPGCQP